MERRFRCAQQAAAWLRTRLADGPLCRVYAQGYSSWQAGQQQLGMYPVQPRSNSAASPQHHPNSPRPPRSTELERLRSQGVEAPRDKADMFFGAAPLDETFSPGKLL